MKFVPRFVDPMRVGVVAEYDSPQALVAAAHAMRVHGYERLDAFTPFEVEGLDELLEVRRTRLPFVVLLAGLLGGALGYLIQWYCNSWNYPINVGGRPIHPIPAFIPVTFESTILLAGVVTFVGFFLASRLPELWNPLFEIEGFERTSVDRYWLAVDRRDLRFDPRATAEELTATRPLRVVPLGAGS